MISSKESLEVVKLEIVGRWKIQNNIDMTKTNDTGWVTQTLNNHNADWNMDICKIKKKYYMITVALLTILCSGCGLRSSISHDPSKVQFIKEMSRMYDKNIIDFFPSDATNGNDWGSFYSSSWEDSVESIFRCCAYFSTNVSAAILDSIEKEEYVVKMDYGDSLFSVDVPYMRHAESYLNPMKDSLQIPIANMRYAYFSLGETIDTIVTIIAALECPQIFIKSSPNLVLNCPQNRDTKKEHCIPAVLFFLFNRQLISV